jgi:hypothetical protein
VVIEGDAILDQLEIGHASPLFMFGTACLATAACVALFAIITAIGLAVSAAFEEEPQQQSTPSEDASGVASVDPSASNPLQFWRPPEAEGPAGIDGAAVPEGPRELAARGETQAAWAQ